MRYIEAPTEYGGSESPALFLAGGISDTENWQSRTASLLGGEKFVLLNPRRRSFPMDDPAAGTVQIEWEYRHLHRADAVLFWFPSETLCPIALYELGVQTQVARPLFVGTDPAYRRRRDLKIQLRLARPEIKIVHSLEELVAQVRAALKSGLFRKEVAT